MNRAFQALKACDNQLRSLEHDYEVDRAYTRSLFWCSLALLAGPSCHSPIFMTARQGAVWLGVGESAAGGGGCVERAGRAELPAGAGRQVWHRGGAVRTR